MKVPIITYMIKLNESCFNETCTGLKMGVPFLQPGASLPNKIDHASSETIMGHEIFFQSGCITVLLEGDHSPIHQEKILPNYFRMWYCHKLSGTTSIICVWKKERERERLNLWHLHKSSRPRNQLVIVLERTLVSLSERVLRPWAMASAGVYKLPTCHFGSWACKIVQNLLEIDDKDRLLEGHHLVSCNKACQHIKWYDVGFMTMKLVPMTGNMWTYCMQKCVIEVSDMWRIIMPKCMDSVFLFSISIHKLSRC